MTRKKKPGPKAKDNDPITFRCPKKTIEALDRLAEELGEDKSTLIRQYVREGIWRMEEKLGFEPDPDKIF